MMDTEQGATDNRLTINPSDFNGIAEDWQDGETYTVTLKIRQTSPGEFVVADMKESESPAEDAAEPQAAEESEAGQAGSGGDGGYGNPAIERMMTGGR